MLSSIQLSTKDIGFVNPIYGITTSNPTNIQKQYLLFLTIEGSCESIL